MVLASVTRFEYAFSLNLDSPLELGIWVKVCENQLQSGKKRHYYANKTTGEVTLSH